MIDFLTILDNAGVAYKLKQDEIITNCPFCGHDTNYHCYVNPDKEVFHCFKCNESGPVRRYIALVLGVAYEELPKVLGDPLERTLSPLRLSMINHTDDRPLEEIKLPPECEPLNRLIPYLVQRRVPIEWLDRYRLGVCKAGYYQHRLIIPCYFGGKLVYWQARDILNEKHPLWRTDKYRKTLNPVGVSASKVIFNWDEALRHDRLIITEGPFDAMRSGPEAIATLGKRISKAQMRMILDGPWREVVFMWDADAVKEMFPYVKILTGRFDVRVVKLPHGDPDSFDMNELEMFIAQTKCWGDRVLRVLQ